MSTPSATTITLSSQTELAGTLPPTASSVVAPAAGAKVGGVLPQLICTAGVAATRRPLGSVSRRPNAGLSPAPLSGSGWFALLVMRRVSRLGWSARTTLFGLNALLSDGACRLRKFSDCSARSALLTVAPACSPLTEPAASTLAWLPATLEVTSTTMSQRPATLPPLRGGMTPLARTIWLLPGVAPTVPENATLAPLPSTQVALRRPPAATRKPLGRASVKATPVMSPFTKLFVSRIRKASVSPT